MRLPTHIGALSLGLSVILSTSAYEKKPSAHRPTLIPEPTAADQAGRSLLVNQEWDKVAFNQFFSAKDKVTLTVHSPKPYKSIKLAMSAPVKLMSARVYNAKKQYITLAFQSPRPVMMSREKVIPSSFGLITKVQVYYRSAQRGIESIHLLGRN